MAGMNKTQHLAEQVNGKTKCYKATKLHGTFINFILFSLRL